MTLPGPEPVVNQLKKIDLEEFTCIDTTSDPLRYSTCNIADCPKGYPMLARFTASASQFYVFREFRYLQSRVLLHLQDEIRALETQLWRMDEKDRVNNPHSLECRELDDACSGKRRIMIDSIHQKLLQYGELLCLSSKLAALERPSNFERTSVLNFFLNKQPIVSQEGYIGNRADLVTLKATRDDAWLDRQILRLLVRANNRLLSWIFSNAKLRENSDGLIVMYSLARIHFFVMTLLILTMLFLFSAPLVPLYEWSQGGIDGKVLAKMMGFQVGCTLMFGGVLSLCTRAKKHEIFGACAAYVAILVVFVGQSASKT
ncbi:hypothetical protein J7T55_013773 [Diaporthe amygdali]|uniref:uncharacterized protein n=1 Tax=Phomopsis amygdali TaxID=1214568 RepID=UPI0022FF45B4|nr:uncharacterized protein J7T55_013773 [Diaporthe amygdali]KAJ0119570.1 hypothetical protein J7T55_013773 [Diaporthe amygdali]